MVLLYLILVVISLMIFGVDLRLAMMRFVLLSARLHQNTRFSRLQIYGWEFYFDKVIFKGGGGFFWFLKLLLDERKNGSPSS